MPQENICAAFDFAFRYAVRDAINQNDWRVLNDTRPTGLNIDNGAYKQYAVTFVENHDVQDRGTTSGYSPDPIRKDTLAANAYLLAMPGTPCVFYTHYLAYPKEIKAMIDARKFGWCDEYEQLSGLSYFKGLLCQCCYRYEWKTLGCCG